MHPPPIQVQALTRAAPQNAIHDFVAREKSRLRLVCGVGLNDSETPIASAVRVNGKTRVTWKCPASAAWADMLYRCYSEKFQKRYPSYQGCSVSPRWLSLSSFHDWMFSQDYTGKHLDKDLLIPGNKVYSAETCVFITPELNNVLTEGHSKIGGLPIGASRHKQGRIDAQCRNPFTKRSEHIGLFDSPVEAHEAWRARKHEHACAYADLQDDHRVARALRTRYLNWDGLHTHDKAMRGAA
jgi:hypothetical protein